MGHQAALGVSTNKSLSKSDVACQQGRVLFSSMDHSVLDTGICLPVFRELLGSCLIAAGTTQERHFAAHLNRFGNPWHTRLELLPQQHDAMLGGEGGHTFEDILGYSGLPPGHPTPEVRPTKQMCWGQDRMPFSVT